MLILFIHQNFPGQFRHLALALQEAGHSVRALALDGRGLPGIPITRYRVAPPPQGSRDGLLHSLEGAVARGSGASVALWGLKQEGYVPDVVVAHPGWGESLYVKDLWPAARLVLFAEYFYRADGADFNFDPEFLQTHIRRRMELRMRNAVPLLSLEAADAAYTPTHWQQGLFPPEYQSKLQVIFDGIDTNKVKPDPQAWVRISAQQADGSAEVLLRQGDEVITFVNRNLEPSRGFHVFMRALPAILRARPQARCVNVGGDSISYGQAPSRESGHTSWRQALLAQVGEQLPLERVHFVGLLAYDNYLSLLQVSACHVYLTYPFVLGWSCLEAMAAGVVVVGSATAPVQEVIEHGRNGLLVDFFDVEALARQVTEVLANRQAHAALGLAARQTVEQDYNLQTSLRQQMELVLA